MRFSRSASSQIFAGRQASRGTFTGEKAIALLAQLLMIAAIGCTSGLRRFPLAEPMWSDAQDLRPFRPPAEASYVNPTWDGVDNLFFRPAARFFAVDPAGEAINVNAMDEVPNSSWFENRLSRRDLTAQEIVRGPCGDTTLNSHGHFSVRAAVPDNHRTALEVVDAQGHRFFLRFDAGARAGAADVIGSRVYWAAGFYTACTRIVHLDAANLQVDAQAKIRRGSNEQPLTQEALQEMLQAYPRIDGRLRVVARDALPGRPLGHWRYDGTNRADPNDVIPHEDRRELRGSYVLAAWLNNAGAQNRATHLSWIPVRGDAGYTQHGIVDFSDSLGGFWRNGRTTRRISSGSSSYLHVPHVAADFVSFGLLHRRYHRRRVGEPSAHLGYFRSALAPDEWHGRYQNPAFTRASLRDKGWMARIVSNIDRDDIEALVAAAQIQHAGLADELTEALEMRRKTIVEHYARQISPLSWPSLRATEGGTDLCLKDLAVRAGVAEWEERPYWARAWQHAANGSLQPTELGRKVRRAPDWICVELPQVESATAENPAYLIVDVAGQFGNERSPPPTRVHLYQTARAQYHLAGVQRPAHTQPL